MSMVTIYSSYYLVHQPPGGKFWKYVIVNPSSYVAVYDQVRSRGDSEAHQTSTPSATDRAMQVLK